MRVTFFQDKCKSGSSSKFFGICDDSDYQRAPAYLDENESNQSERIGKVNNSGSKIIEFFAIDNCVELLRPDGRMQNRCDGLLRFDNILIFVELKSRYKRWLGKGREQLTETIHRFEEEHGISSFKEIKAYSCNNIRPRTTTNHMAAIQKFKDSTGLILRVEQEILIT